MTCGTSYESGTGIQYPSLTIDPPCRVGSVGSMSASRTVGREFASWPGHTKDHH